MRRLLIAALWLICWRGILVAANPVPFLNVPLVPTDAAPGGPAFTLTVNGGGFVSGAVVDWNGNPLATTFVSPTKLTAAVPAADIASVGTATVSVVNPGSSILSNPLYFDVRTSSSAVYYSAPPVSGYSGVPEFVGDFGNGRPDILTAGTTGAIVRLSNGDGTFSDSPMMTYPPGFNEALCVADFNGDGKLDVVLEDTQSGALVTMLGNGDGTFSQGPTSSVGTGQFYYTLPFVADFNGDGKLDFIGNTTTGAPGTAQKVQVYWGNGDGTFSAGPITTLPTTGPNNAEYDLVGIGDFNGDGKLDLVVEDYNQVMVMLGNGDGTFTPAPGPAYDIGAFSIDPAIADFNGDGKLDVAVASYSSQPGYPVTVLLGNGDGTFTPVPSCCGLYAYGTEAGGVIAGDFTGNGKIDLLAGITNEASGAGGYYFEILLGNGDGTFTTEDWTELEPNYEVGLWAADFDGDGMLDLAYRPGNGGVAIRLQGSAPATKPDFTLSMASPSVTVKAGATATDDFEIADVGGFLGPLSPLTCAGPPPTTAISCSVYQPPDEIFPTAKGSFPVTVTTQATAYSSLTGPSANGRLPMIIWLAGMAVLAADYFRRRRKLRRASLVPLLVTLLVGLSLGSSCGSARKVVGGTPPGSYYFTVTATSGAVTHSASFTLVVQ